MPEETLYELKKDVQIPGHYWRAGIRKTEKEWKEIFHMSDDYPFQWEREWFIDLRPQQEQPTDGVADIVDEVFEKEGLKSISYKEAAAKAIRLALTRLKQ